MRKSARLTAYAAVTASIAFAAPAFAQSSDDPVVIVVADSTQSQSALPDLAGEDAELSDVRAGIGVVGTLTYDDNILAARIKKDDWASLISPYITASGKLGAAAIGLRAQLDRYDYFNTSSENRTDIFVGGRARVPMSSAFRLNLGAGWSQTHQDRGDAHASRTDAEPTRYNLTEANASISSHGLGVKLGFAASWRHFDFTDTRRTIGGFENNDDRDRDNFRASATIGGGVRKGMTFFGRAVYENVNYSSTLDDFGKNRDSSGYRVIGGLDVDLIWGFHGEVYAGYVERNYPDATFRDYHHAVYGASINWIPLPDWEIAFVFDPLILEAVDPRFSGTLTQTFAINMKHKFSEMLSGTLSLGFAEEEFIRATTTAVTVTRSDETYTLGLGLNYALNKHIDIGAKYNWTDRSSGLPATRDSYNRSRFLASLNVHY